jgi:branched-chain amino acid transport system permease protein
MSVREASIFAGAVLALFLVPLVSPSNFYINLATEILIFAIAAVGLNLLLGYGGLASFGHAAFFGLGAYSAGLLSIEYSSLLPVTLGIALLVSVSAAMIGGLVALRTKGIYFIFLTLALAQAVYAIGFKWRWLTGGSDGLPGIPRPTLGLALDELVKPDTAVGYYAIVAVGFVLVLWAMMRLVQSPVGSVIVAIRDNDQRAEAIGYRAGRYRLLAFVVSAGITGIAGAFYAHFNRLVAPDQLSWQTSAILIMMVVVGGAGTLLGPLIGAAAILLLQNVVSSYTERWPTIMGLVFIAFVLSGRNGIWGLALRILVPRRRS